MFISRLEEWSDLRRGLVFSGAGMRTVPSNVTFLWWRGGGHEGSCSVGGEGVEGETGYEEIVAPAVGGVVDRDLGMEATLRHFCFTSGAVESAVLMRSIL